MKKNLPKDVSLTEEARAQEIPYVRVGDDFYKRIVKKDPLGFERPKLKHVRRVTILDDHNKDFLKKIPRYDDFEMVPDYLNYQKEVNGCLNLFSEISHVPEPGEWTWTKRLLEHVFGDQYELGLRYFQILYLHPNRSTIILALVSRERQTGKTTFINWLAMLFQNNMITLSSNDFLSSFNGYAHRNIIALEETLLEKNTSIEKLKAMSTAKRITINEKFVTPYEIPFFGKIVIASNHEERFAKIDQEEVRFLVRKLQKPKFSNHNIEQDLLSEIPAFLHHLTTLPPVDWSVSRSGFSTEELANEFLGAVVKESRSGLAKDLEILIQEFFLNDPENMEFFHATVGDIKERWFANDAKTSPHYIGRVLKEEFGKTPELRRYAKFGEEVFGNNAVGRAYQFNRCDFVTSNNTVNGDVTG